MAQKVVREGLSSQLSWPSTRHACCHLAPLRPLGTLMNAPARQLACEISQKKLKAANLWRCRRVQCRRCRCRRCRCRRRRSARRSIGAAASDLLCFTKGYSCSHTFFTYQASNMATLRRPCRCLQTPYLAA